MQRALTATCLIAVGLAAQEPALAPKPPNAADLYGRARDEVQRRFGITGTMLVELPDMDAVAAEPFADPAWDAAIARAGNALDLFAQAACTPHCSFGPGREPAETSYDEAAFQLHQLAMLTLARGWRTRVDHPIRAAEDALTVLSFSRHVFAQMSLRSGTMGYCPEDLGLRLLAVAAPELLRTGDSAQIARCRAGFAAYQRQRPSLAALTAGQERAALLMIDTVLTAKQPPIGIDQGSPIDTFLQLQQAAVRQRFAALAAEMFEPLLQEPLAASAAIDKQMQALVSAWKKDTDRKRVQREFARFTDEQRIDVLSKLFALVLLPDVAAFARLEEESHKRMRECADRLAGSQGK